MRYVFDLDGTLCSVTESGRYSEAKPFLDRIEIVNGLFKSGHEIVIFTARGMASSSGDCSQAKLKWESITVEQLNLWQVSYHELIFCKPAADLYVDDKASLPMSFFQDNC